MGEGREGYIRDPPAVAKKIHVPTYEEILERIKSRYPRRARTLFDKQMASIQKTYDVSISKTNFVRELTRLLDGLHPFYWRLIEIEFDRERVRRAISCISKARKVASRLFEKYRFLLMASSGKKELLATASEARGRILSLFKKCRRELDYLRDLVVFIQHLPSIDAGLPTIIVSGAPSTGKSTLVRNVTRARPRVASYPFTTTSIHIGHFTIGDEKIQIIDTPGLLDRPIDEMNEVERKAVAALSEIDGIILFLVDVSEDAYIDVGRQYRLLDTVKRLTPGKKIVAVINKVDAADPASLEKARLLASSMLEAKAITDVIEASLKDPEEARRVVERVGRILLEGSTSY